MFLINAEGGTLHVSLVPIAEPTDQDPVDEEFRQFSADIVLPEYAGDVSVPLQKLVSLGYVEHKDFHVLVDLEGSKMIGFSCHVPKVAQIVLSYC
jgi:hypothetical protein